MLKYHLMPAASASEGIQIAYTQGSPSHRSTHFASPSGSIASSAALSMDFTVLYCMSAGQNMPCSKLK